MSVKKSTSTKKSSSGKKTISKKTVDEKQSSTEGKKTTTQAVVDLFNHILEAEWTTGAGKVNLIALCGFIFLCIIIAARNPVESYGFGNLCNSFGGFCIIALISVSIASKSLELQKMKKVSNTRKSLK